MSLWDADPAAFATWGTTIATCHGCGRRGLVEEDEGVGIEFVLGLEPVFALGLYVGPVLLSRVRRVFLRVIP